MAELAHKSIHKLQRRDMQPGDVYIPPDTLDTLSVRSMLEKMRDGCMVMDDSGVVRFVNKGAARLLDVPRSKAHGSPFQTLFTLMDSKTHQRINDPLAHLLARTEVNSYGRCELLMRHDGKVIPFDYSISFLNGGRRDTSRLLLLMLRDASRTYTRIKQLVKAVRHDEHTHLLRRGELERRLARILKTMSAGDHHALLFMDLDRFKAINDSAGHAAGDSVLLEVAKVFRTQVRERDTLARLGGDEFGLLLEHCPLAQARELAMTLHSAITHHVFEADGRRFTLGLSIGIVSIRRRHVSVREVFSAADTACYTAKRKTDLASHIEESILS